MANGEEVPREDNELAGVPAVPGDPGDHPSLQGQGRGSVALPPEVKELVLTGDKIKRLWTKISAIPKFTDDRYTGADTIIKQFMSPSVVMLELGDEDGLLVAEDVKQNGYIIVHIIVFNSRKYPTLERILRDTIAWFFHTFSPNTMAAWIPANNAAALSLIRRLGWNCDGLIRGLMLYYGKRTDTYVFSVREEEL